MLTAFVCQYQLHEDGDWCDGIAISHAPGVSDVLLIVDGAGKPLPDAPWNYSREEHRGAFVIPA